MRSRGWSFIAGLVRYLGGIVVDKNLVVLAGSAVVVLGRQGVGAVAGSVGLGGCGFSSLYFTGCLVRYMRCMAI
ncbi:hypothetical protein BJV78DRAFT_1217022 [Lactifluus subvellereus]|nr:hypothetical protein BJV78DRAFT_1217022 [Lactifluus subvellereus]